MLFRSKHELSNCNICYIIEYGPDEYKAKALEQLFRQGVNIRELRTIIKYGPDEYKAKAWKHILEKGMDNDDLCYIIKYGPNKYKAKAWKQLFKQNPKNLELKDIIKHSESVKYKIMAEELLKAREELKDKSKEELIKMLIEE